MPSKQHTPPDLPPMKDLTVENITDNVHTINSKCTDPRLRFLFERLVNHLHDFARETRLSITEWEAAIKFLVGVGTVLGPFHTLDAHHVEHGHQISHDPDGEPLFAFCTVKNTEGQPIPNVAVDVWETDSKGFYDVQYENRTTPDGRAIVKSDENGVIQFNAIIPVPYPIPDDGPVGKLLERLNRHCYRPSHMHFMFQKEGYDRLITALYLRGDPFETSDAVFGVKDSLVINLGKVGHVEGLATKYGVSPNAKLLQYDFVLITEQESQQALEEEAWKEAKRQNCHLRVVNGLLVPE